MGALGIGDDDMVVVYDGAGHVLRPARLVDAQGHGPWQGRRCWMAACRNGKRKAARWKTGPPSPSPHILHRAIRQAAIIRDFDAVKGALGQDAQIAGCAQRAAASTARKPNRAPACDPATCPARSIVPWRSVLTADGTLKDDASLQQLFAEKGIDLRAPIVTTCGSGISAAILMLALDEIGRTPDVALYDGSWTEWGGRARSAGGRQDDSDGVILPDVASP